MDNVEMLNAYLDDFEERLRTDLLRLCTEKKVLEGMLLETPDLSEWWKGALQDYVADAVPEVSGYPTVSVGWAAYIGLAMAFYWHLDWASHSDTPYRELYGSQGFDNMDDHIVADIMGIPLDSPEADALTALIQEMAELTVSKIRHERIEPQSPMAFHVFARACNAMFAAGAAVELSRLGYEMRKLQ